jgi:hypothetical protein
MAETDRNARYRNPPKVKHGKVQNRFESRAQAGADKAESAEGAGKGPTDKNPGPVGKVGQDKGPEGSPSPEFGIVADRHKREHGEMTRRHGEAQHSLHEAHTKEANDLQARHAKELQDTMEQAASKKANATAGTPKELGRAKDEGGRGSNA